MESIYRLNYIGSKYNLLDWIVSTLKSVTGHQTLEGLTIADLFSGTGIVSYHLRTLGATVLSNDAELYSSVIAKAMTICTYTPRCQELIAQLNEECKTSSQVGYVTVHYSPHEGNERMFFTEENAKRIDYLRNRIEQLNLEPNEYAFLLASLLVSADRVSNVPAVYGCYLKSFKDRATRDLELVPIHMNSDPAVDGSRTYNSDVLTLELPAVDVAYLDPPYNGRQYSKNYFPLNIIAKTPSELETEPPLKGKTGIPEDCFLSPFCRKKEALDSFDKLFRTLPAKYILLSYSSEGIVTKDVLQSSMEKYGTVTVFEQPYKKFKSFEYNEDAKVTEYLFCLTKSE